MNQIFFPYWHSSKTQNNSSNNQISIYIDSTFQSNIKIDFKQNMLIDDILQYIHDDDKQNLDLVLINDNIQRRLWKFEKVEEVLSKNCKFVIYDFKKKQTQNLQKEYNNFDDNFRAWGKLMKKNKFGIYVQTIVYLSSSYFGFKNEKKEKIKLSRLENLKIFLWQNNTKFDFQIQNEKKLYFFQAHKEIDYDYWIKNIEDALQQANYRCLIHQLDDKIIEATKTQLNRIEEFAYDSLQQVKLNGDYLKTLRSQITDICDVNIIQFLITKNEDLIPHIRSQIRKDTYKLLQPIEPQYQVEPLNIFTSRYHILFENDEIDKIIEKLNDEIESTYAGFLKIQKIKQKITYQPRIQFKEQYSQFQPNFDQFYH